MNNDRLDPHGLAQLRDQLAEHVERGPLPGLVALVGRGEESHVFAVGTFERDGAGAPMATDTIFRISSTSKPITAAAAMFLVDDGVLGLDEPVDDHLPELADRRVLRRLDAPIHDAVPANRPITLRDLLTFRSGHGAVFADPATTPIVQAVLDLDLALGPPRPQHDPEPDEWIRRIGSLPLLDQPGERWLYHTGADIVGVLIARASGRSFPDVLHERILEPLGMADTGFFVPTDELARFPTQYATDPTTGDITVYDEPDGQWNSPPPFPSGGAGLVSTVSDLLAFSEMMLGGGERHGVRVLSPEAVEQMTTNHLTAEQRTAAGFSDDDGPGTGWGFGMSVVVDPLAGGLSAGSFGWDGGLGTSWIADPVRGATLVLLTQVAWASPQPPAVFDDFRVGAIRALDG